MAKEQAPINAVELALLYDATDGEARRILCNLLDERQHLQETVAQLRQQLSAQPAASQSRSHICPMCGERYLIDDGHRCYS